MNRRAFILLAILLAWCGRDGARAQTQIPASQVKVEAVAPGTVPLVIPFLAIIEGRFYFIEPGPGLAIQPGAGGRLVLVSTAIAPTVREKEEYPPRLTAQMTSFTLTEVPIGVLNYYRNGLRGKPGEYTVAGKLVTFTAVGPTGSIPQAGDDLAFVYHW